MFFLQQNVIKKFSKYWKPVTFALLLVLWLITIPDGHDWGGDFSQYVHHAINLVNGSNYTDTGYIHNVFAFVGPTAYPPVFPFILALIYALFGFNLLAFKVIIVISFISALYFSTFIFKNKLSNIYQFVFVITLALNPYFWLLKNQILSDSLFMLLVFITFMVLNKRYIQTDAGYFDSKRKDWVYALFVGVLLYLNYATRDIGIVFIPTIIVFELFHFRKVTLVTIVAVIIFAVLTGFQQRLIQPPAYNAERAERLEKLAHSQGQQSAVVSHADFINLDISHVLKQGIMYLKSLRDLWPVSNSNSILLQSAGWTALFLFFIFTFGGYLQSVIRGPGFVDIFVAGYIAVLLLFAGVQGLRYLLPLVPVFFLYAFKQHEILLKSKYKKGMVAIAVVFIITTIVSYTTSSSYTKNFSLGITNSNARSFLNYVRESTPKESIFVFQKPRVLSLLAQRQASGLPGDRGGSFIVDYMEAIGATYLVHSAIDFNGFSHPVSALTPQYAGLTLVFNNEHFYVYKRILK